MLGNGSERTRSQTEIVLGDVGLALIAGFLSMFGGSFLLAKTDFSTGTKTWLAMGTGLGLGALAYKFSKPIAFGIAAGFGGLGLTAFTAQAAGATQAGQMFGFAEVRAAREGRELPLRGLASAKTPTAAASKPGLPAGYRIIQDRPLGG